MSLKDLLPDGTYEQITEEAGNYKQDPVCHTEGPVTVNCPNCGRKIIYSPANEFRPFCSLGCKMRDLGAWADERRTIPGNSINEDEDADLVEDPHLPKKF